MLVGRALVTGCSRSNCFRCLDNEINARRLGEGFFIDLDKVLILGKNGKYLRSCEFMSCDLFTYLELFVEEHEKKDFQVPLKFVPFRRTELLMRSLNLTPRIEECWGIQSYIFHLIFIKTTSK